MIWCRKAEAGDRGYMDIWKILDIEPTADRRAIRKAYAARTRVIHPEERPEEFKQLHEAYQAALRYADSGKGRAEKPGQDIDKEKSGSGRHKTKTAGRTERQDQREEGPDLYSYFAENQKRQQEYTDTFLLHWKNYGSPHQNPALQIWWKDYLSTEEYQSIRYHPQVLRALTEEIDGKFFGGAVYEVKMMFWDAYGFQEERKAEYQGEIQKLYHCLYPGYEWHKKKQEQQKEDGGNGRFLPVLYAVIAAVCLVIAISVCYHDVWRRTEDGRSFLEAYLAGQYPGDEFSVSEKGDRQSDSTIIYTMRPSAHPDFLITAELEYRYADGQGTYVVHENYKRLLVEYYAGLYGVECGQEHDGYTGGGDYGVLVYRDIGQLDDFCDTVTRMFQEEEELQSVPSVGICAGNILFPSYMLQGGTEGLSFANQQIYNLHTLKKAELKSLIWEDYMRYLFQYESWNLTTQQYREWGPAYEKLCSRWQECDGDWHEIVDPDTGETICRVYLPVYEKWDGYRQADGISWPEYTRTMTVGSAYYFLQDRDAHVKVNRDGSGFTVEFYGTAGEFGAEPEVEFDELREWY